MTNTQSSLIAPTKRIPIAFINIGTIIIGVLTALALFFFSGIHALASGNRDLTPILVGAAVFIALSAIISVIMSQLKKSWAWALFGMVVAYAPGVCALVIFLVNQL